MCTMMGGWVRVRAHAKGDESKLRGKVGAFSQNSSLQQQLRSSGGSCYGSCSSSGGGGSSVPMVTSKGREWVSESDEDITVWRLERLLNLRLKYRSVKRRYRLLNFAGYYWRTKSEHAK